MSKKSKQPLLQNPGVVGVLASLLSIVIGLVLGFILLVVLNPGASLEGMRAMMTTGFASMDKLGKVLYQAAPLMMCGLSVGFAFKTGLFNIGAPGQYTMGSFFALLCAILGSSACWQRPSAVRSGASSPACSRHTLTSTRSLPPSCSTGSACTSST